MSASKFTKEERLNLIMECRKSGLSDYAWCKRMNIPSGTFYHWLKEARKAACEIPESAAKNPATVKEIEQEVVKLDLSLGERHMPDMRSEQNACFIDSSNVVGSSAPSIMTPTININFGALNISATNDANPMLIATILTSIGGGPYAR